MTAALVLDKLYSHLWSHYKQRVPYAATYQLMVEQRGGRVQNDHVAFRTFNCDGMAQPPGVDAIARIFVPLGYEQRDKYIFTDKKLTAWHWQHKTDDRNPKIFISQLEVDQLPQATASIIKDAVRGGTDFLAPKERALLGSLGTGTALPDAETDELAAHLVKCFTRPWAVPKRAVIEDVNKVSQYAAWTLLHGNAVNHFTAYINEQNVKDWPDIEATATALRDAGVPMKAEFEGERGTKLRQTSTAAADDMCDVMEADGKTGKLKWSYAYYELAERGNVPGPDGKPIRFHAFLGEQATNLFEMTRRG